MSRDYKSRRGTSSKGGGSLILGIFIGYALGLISAIGVWLYINQAPSPDFAALHFRAASVPTALWECRSQAIAATGRCPTSAPTGGSFSSVLLTGTRRKGLACALRCGRLASTFCPAALLKKAYQRSECRIQRRWTQNHPLCL